MAGKHAHNDRPPSGAPGPHPGLSIDPLCKMLVDENDPPGGHVDHKGKRYYFCSAGCREAFAAAPDEMLRWR